MSTLIRIAVCCGLLTIATIATAADTGATIGAQKSISDRSFQWPSWQQWIFVLTLRDYNTRVVIIGTTLLGCAAGMIGSFTLLRRRALMGDAISHATLPGICIAFMGVTMWGGDGKSLVVLLIGATLTGLLGVAAILVIRNLTRLKEDAALGAVLSVFFGAGIALLGVIQQMEEGHAAGLESFIYGKTASMGIRDTWLIAAAALLCITVCLMLFKEFKLLCFDEGFGGSRGLPIVWLDLVLMSVVVIVSIVGLQAVGLILMIALLVIPAAAARFWTEKMWRMFLIAGALGAASGMAGAAASALFSKLPSGAMIVLVCALFFGLSMIFGPKRGILLRWHRRWTLNRSIDRQHLLRAIYEILEASGQLDPSSNRCVTIDDLLQRRSWSMRRLKKAIFRAQLEDAVHVIGQRVELTRAGMSEAKRLTRQHRLWELYLITYADVAPGRVDSGADAIEHVLEPEVIDELEVLLEESFPALPASPHRLGAEGGVATMPGGG